MSFSSCAFAFSFFDHIISCSGKLAPDNQGKFSEWDLRCDAGIKVDKLKSRPGENSTLNQRNVRISAAFNGWLYSAYSTYNTTSNSGGITFRRSKNGGVTWTTLDSYLVTNVKYDVFDIVVVGTDTNNLTLFMTGVNNNVTGGTYTLFFDKYNATTGVFTGNWGTGINYGTRKVYDAAIASDYKFPAFGASPYSIGVIYSVYGSPRDWLFSFVQQMEEQV